MRMRAGLLVFSLLGCVSSLNGMLDKLHQRYNECYKEQIRKVQNVKDVPATDVDRNVIMQSLRVKLSDATEAYVELCESKGYNSEEARSAYKKVNDLTKKIKDERQEQIDISLMKFGLSKFGITYAAETLNKLFFDMMQCNQEEFEIPSDQLEYVIAALKSGATCGGHEIRPKVYDGLLHRLKNGERVFTVEECKEYSRQYFIGIPIKE